MFGRGPSRFLYRNTRGYVSELMNELPPSRTLRGRKDVCSGRRDHISIKATGRYSSVSDSTHPLKTCINLALFDTMIVKLKKAYGA